MNRQSEFFKGVYFYDNYKELPWIMESNDPERAEWVTEFVNNIQSNFKDENVTHLKILCIKREDVDMLLLFPVMDEYPNLIEDVDGSLGYMPRCTRAGLTFYVPVFKIREAQSKYGKGNVTFTGFIIQLSTSQTKVPETNAANALMGG